MKTEQQTSSQGVGDRLKLLIEEWGISDYRLAKAINKSGSTIHRIVKNNTIPTRDTVKAIVDYFNINEKWLLTGTGERDVTFKNVRDTNASNLTQKDIVEYDGNKFMDIGAGRYLMLSPYVSGDYQDKFQMMSREEKVEFLNNAPYHPIPVSSLLTGSYISYEVTTTEMESADSNTVKKGSVVTAKCLHKDLWNKMLTFSTDNLFVIIHPEGIMLREVLQHDTDKKAICVHAYNPKYPDMYLDLDDCEYVMVVTDVSYHL